MKRLHLTLAFTALFASAPIFAQAPAAPAAPAVPAPAAPPAKPKVELAPQAPDVAAPKMDGKTGEPQAGFMNAHQRFVDIAKKGDTGLLFLGDSITEGWGGQKATWEKAFGAYKPANFGIGGDRTQHVLWRIENGELEGIQPKVAVLMIGTNNAGSDSAEGIAAGITKIVQTLRTKLPNTKVLLLAIFPRGEKPGGTREKLAKVNETIAKLADGTHVTFLDIGAKFLEPDGTLSKEIMPDFLHLSPKGYQIWADAITPKLAELMK